MIKPNIVKNLIWSVLFVLGIFLIACEEEEEEENPLQGKWSGTYSGGDSGTWEADVVAILHQIFLLVGVVLFMELLFPPILLVESMEIKFMVDCMMEFYNRSLHLFAVGI